MPMCSVGSCNPATAAQVTRKDKDTGEKVKCLEASGINDFTATV